MLELVKQLMVASNSPLSDCQLISVSILQALQGLNVFGCHHFVVIFLVNGFCTYYNYEPVFCAGNVTVFDHWGI